VPENAAVSTITGTEKMGKEEIGRLGEAGQAIDWKAVITNDITGSMRRGVNVKTAARYLGRGLCP